MGFNEIPKVETAKFYLDLAFSRATKEASSLRSSKMKGDRLNIQKNIELTKLKSIKSSLKEVFNRIIKTFPSIDQLDDFYMHLIKCYFSIGDFRKALSSVNWGITKLADFHKDYSYKIKLAKSLDEVNKLKSSYYGRISSLLKRLKVHLEFLELARRDMRSFPTIKTKLFSVALFGFPNVGKSTLLNKLGGSKAKISNYAFTTKQLNMAYTSIDEEKIQLLDTPGSLNRFEKLNDIEKQAYLALKYVAHVIVYVFDLTEASYPLKDQLKLFNSLKEFDKPVVVYLSKTDLIDDADDRLSKLKLSVKVVSDLDSLRKEISEEIY